MIFKIIVLNDQQIFTIFSFLKDFFKVSKIEVVNPIKYLQENHDLRFQRYLKKTRSYLHYLKIGFNLYLIFIS